MNTTILTGYLEIKSDKNAKTIKSTKNSGKGVDF